MYFCCAQDPDALRSGQSGQSFDADGDEINPDAGFNVMRDYQEYDTTGYGKLGADSHNVSKESAGKNLAKQGQDGGSSPEVVLP